MALKCGIIERSLRLLPIGMNKSIEDASLLILATETVLLDKFITVVDFFSYNLHDLFKQRCRFGVLLQHLWRALKTGYA